MKALSKATGAHRLLLRARRRVAPTVKAMTAQRHTSKRHRREENEAGPFWVDSKCIDCDACRWIAPETFSSVNSASAVTAQPVTPERRHTAFQALLSCPTFSIHVDDRSSEGELSAARDSFPLKIPGTNSCYHLGHHAEASYGAAPYFIQRENGGNIMIDVPRWSPQLAQRLKNNFGGVELIFLTHRDDVGDHIKWAKELGAKRIIHSLEANTRQGTDKAEWKLEGEGPWHIGGHDVELIFTPGHTRGCVSLLYSPDKALFTGDHLAYSQRLNRLTIFRAYNWYNVPLQLESVDKLLNFEFVHILPGHGRRASFPTNEARVAAMNELLHAEGYVSSSSSSNTS